MTISASWCWWTYFLVGDHFVTCGQIEDYDIATKSLTYLRRNGNDPEQNPYQPGTPEHSSWCWDTVDGSYDRILVDPTRAISLSQDDIELLRTGKRPAEFIELEDADPREFFGDDQKLVSTYLPSHLLKRIHGNTESENGVQ